MIHDATDYDLLPNIEDTLEFESNPEPVQSRSRYVTGKWINTSMRIYRHLGYLVLAVAVAIAPSAIEAGSLARAVGKAATARLLSVGPAKAATGKGAVAAAKVTGTKAGNSISKNAREGLSRYQKPRDVIISRAKHPQAAAHIEHAQKKGQPTVLHIDRSRAAERRTAAIGNVNSKRKPVSGYERDEYPPAFTREGGVNANVRFIDPHDNRGAGAVMRWQSRDLPDGSKIRVLVK